MSIAMRRTLAQAAYIADRFEALLVPHRTCERFEFAGSFRRRRPDVGDIDCVAIPRVECIPADDMFATPTDTNLLWNRIDDLLKLGTFSKHIKDTAVGERTKWGDTVRAIEFEGCAFEVELCHPDNWGLKLAIRTGPEEVSKYFVDPRRGLPARGFVVKDGFRVYYRNGGLVKAPTEEQIFQMAGLPYTPPEARK